MNRVRFAKCPAFRQSNERSEEFLFRWFEDQAPILRHCCLRSALCFSLGSRSVRSAAPYAIYPRERIDRTCKRGDERGMKKKRMIKREEDEGKGEEEEEEAEEEEEELGKRRTRPCWNVSCWPEDEAAEAGGGFSLSSFALPFLHRPVRASKQQVGRRAAPGIWMEWTFRGLNEQPGDTTRRPRPTESSRQQNQKWNSTRKQKASCFIRYYHLLYTTKSHSPLWHERYSQRNICKAVTKHIREITQGRICG